MHKSNSLNVISVFLAACILFASCASTTLIQTTPDNAKIYINGEPVGSSPYTYTDTKIVGSTNHVKIEKEGYKTLNTSFSRNEEADIGAIVGGLLLLVPFLWTMKYKATHSYELEPLNEETDPKSSDTKPAKEEKSKDTASKADRLRELKKLLDDKIITQEEYDQEKKKILDE